jgi:hypothetical protein
LEESFRIIKNLQLKILANQFIVRSLGFHFYLYEAKSRFPENISDGDQAILLSEILYGYAEGKGELEDKWSEFQENYLWNVTKWIIYLDESS